MGSSYTEILVILGVFVALFFIYQLGKKHAGEITEAEQNSGGGEITEAQREQFKISRKKFLALRGRMEMLTVAEIADATGLHERSIRAMMTNHGLECRNFDGAEMKKRDEADKGKSAAQLAAERMEKQTIGTLSSKVKCPHCDTVGQVYKNTNVRQTETTQSARLTAVLLEGERITSRTVTQFHCKNCETTWNI